MSPTEDKMNCQVSEGFNVTVFLIKFQKDKQKMQPATTALLLGRVSNCWQDTFSYQHAPLLLFVRYHFKPQECNLCKTCFKAQKSLNKVTAVYEHTVVSQGWFT